MFEGLDKKAKAKAKADLNLAKIMVSGFRLDGKSHEEIKTLISAFLYGKAWHDEVMEELFDPRARQRREYEQRERERQEQRRQWYEQWRGYNRTSSPPPPQGISLNEALQFFGFTTLPDKTELKRQYLMLALKLHPDKGGDTAIFQKFQNYKEILWRRVGL